MLGAHYDHAGEHIVGGAPTRLWLSAGDGPCRTASPAGRHTCCRTGLGAVEAVLSRLVSHQRRVSPAPEEGVVTRVVVDWMEPWPDAAAATHLWIARTAVVRGFSLLDVYGFRGEVHVWFDTTSVEPADGLTVAETAFGSAAEGCGFVWAAWQVTDAKFSPATPPVP